MPSVLVQDSSFKVRVSSVLNRDVNAFGKKHIFDGLDDTCWNSDEGTPQWVSLSFSNSPTISGYTIQFQGGFVGQDCRIEISQPGSADLVSEPFYPEDVNSVQSFSLAKSMKATHLKFIFEKSTDFFGRIVIYSMDVFADS